MPIFEREGQIDIRDILNTRLEPSRALGPPDPGAPEQTWLQGYTPTPAPIPLPPAGVPPQQLPLAAATAGDQAAVVEQMGEVPDLLLFETGFVNFGGEAFTLSHHELANVVEIVLEAYERTLQDRAAALRGRYLQPQPRQPEREQDNKVQEPSAPGPEVVPEMHQPQEETDLSPPSLP